MRSRVDFSPYAAVFCRAHNQKGAALEAGQKLIARHRCPGDKRKLQQPGLKKLSPPYTRHIFVCTNRRPDGSAKGCCATKGADDVRLALKRAVDEAEVKGVRVNASGCLDACERGVSVVVYPEGIWYGGVKPEDAAELVERHLEHGEVVERLRMAPIEPRKK